MKRITPSTIGVGVLAILFGLVAAHFARHAFEREAGRPPAVKTAESIRAKANLPKYDQMVEDDIEFVGTSSHFSKSGSSNGSSCKDRSEKKQSRSMRNIPTLAPPRDASAASPSAGNVVYVRVEAQSTTN